MLPLGHIIHRYGLSYNLYTDDTQLYMSFKHTDPFPIDVITPCINKINILMTKNFLKLKTDKTDLLLVGPPKCTSSLNIDKINITGCHVKPPTTIKNLGIVFDSSVFLLSHLISHQICLLSSTKYCPITPKFKYQWCRDPCPCFHYLLSRLL